MRLRCAPSLSRRSLFGLGVGLAAGAAAGLLAAPTRGSRIRASLRSRAERAVDRGMMLLEERRRAVRIGGGTAMGSAPPLSAAGGEIAEWHSGDELSNPEGRS
jgi:hypothetical protein